MDPSFGSNYYNACKYYYYNKSKVWCLIYGEIFVNIESRLISQLRKVEKFDVDYNSL